VDQSEAIRNAYALLSSGDIDRFGELISDDFVEHEEMPGMPPTKAGVLDLFRMIRGAFPDMTMTPDDILVSGDKVVSRVTTTGTHRGDFLGIPASGQPVSIQVIDIMRFDEAGLFCEHWGLTDMMSLMQQIGAIPTGP
jgi:steroid delta-isomerase-like uncharacterized protein